MAGTVNPQLPLPTPSSPDPRTILHTFIGWANSLVTQLFSFGQRINLCLPKDGTEAMTGPLNGTSAVFSGSVTSANPKARAHATVATSVLNATWTKLALDTKDFDTNSNFASSRFTPTIAGYYEVNANVTFTVTGIIAIAVYKNGSPVSQSTTGSGVQQGVPISDVVFCNGTTDFLEIFVFQSSGATANNNVSSAPLNFASFIMVP